MIAQFSRLVQAGMTVAEYHVRFINLYQYDPSVVANLILRCIKFREVLGPNIRSQLTAFSFIKFHQLFSTAQRIENDILRKTEEREKDKNSGQKKKKCQCKGKDRKEMLLVAAVDLLEVVVSYPIITTLVVRRVIVNEYSLRRQQTLLAGERQQGSKIGSVS